MNVAVASEVRFEKDPDGIVWASAVPASFWTRYLDVFDEVRVVARIKNVPRPSPGLVQSSGPRVVFVEVPNYQGPWQFLQNAVRVRLALRTAVGCDDAVVLRIGSLVGSLLQREIARDGRPYGVEVVGDPDDVFGPGGIEHPLRPALRWWFTREQKRLCEAACAAAYVTKSTLQAKYPCRTYTVGISDVEIGRTTTSQTEVALAVHYSSIDLRPADFAKGGRDYPLGRTVRLVTVGSLAQTYKGTDVLLEAMARSVADGLDLSLSIIGEGALRPRFERQADALNLGSRVSFLGSVTSDAVRNCLDASDLFVLPSRTEGLPRAMIEAMARGLPCIGSAVGGIPELLHPRELFRPGDPQSLAAKIREIVTDPARMAVMAQRNLSNASEFHVDVLRPRRRMFYEHLRQCTDRWFMKKACGGSALPARTRWS